MKKRISLLLAIVMVLSVVLPVIPFSAVAADTETEFTQYVDKSEAAVGKIAKVAKTGEERIDGKGTYFATIGEAVNHLKRDGSTGGETLILLGNITGAQLEFYGFGDSEENRVIFDGNGYTFNYNATNYAFLVYGGKGYTAGNSADDATKWTNEAYPYGRITVRNLTINVTSGGSSGGFAAYRKLKLDLENVQATNLTNAAYVVWRNQASGFKNYVNVTNCNFNQAFSKGQNEHGTELVVKNSTIATVGLNAGWALNAENSTFNSITTAGAVGELVLNSCSVTKEINVASACSKVEIKDTRIINTASSNALTIQQPTSTGTPFIIDNCYVTSTGGGAGVRIDRGNAKITNTYVQTVSRGKGALELNGSAAMNVELENSKLLATGNTPSVSVPNNKVTLTVKNSDLIALGTKQSVDVTGGTITVEGGHIASFGAANAVNSTSGSVTLKGGVVVYGNVNVTGGTLATTGANITGTSVGSVAADASSTKYDFVVATIYSVGADGAKTKVSDVKYSEITTKLTTSSSTNAVAAAGTNVYVEFVKDIKFYINNSINFMTPGNAEINGNGANIIYTGPTSAPALRAYGSDSTGGEASKKTSQILTFKNIEVLSEISVSMQIYFCTVNLNEGVVYTSPRHHTIWQTNGNSILNVNAGAVITTGNNGSAAIQVSGGSSAGATLNVNTGAKVVAEGTTSTAVRIDTPANVNIYGGYFESVNGTTIVPNKACTVNVYDCYVIAKGTGNALATASGDAGGGVVNVYGGAFIVSATGATARDWSGKMTYNIYGGQFADYQTFNNWGLAGSYKHHASTFVFAGPRDEAHANSANFTVSAVDGTPLYIYANKVAIPTIVAGASIRLNTNSHGIRFISNIPAATLAYAEGLKDADTKVTYGTAVVPTHYIADNGLNVLSVEALESFGVSVVKIEGTAKGTTADEDGNLTLRAALTDIPDEYLNMEFSAVPYVKYIKDGQEVYIYGVYDAVKNTRSMAQVANAALADVVDEKTEIYVYMDEVTGKYSPYSAKQRAILEDYIEKAAK